MNIESVLKIFLNGQLVNVANISIRAAVVLQWVLIIFQKHLETSTGIKAYSLEFLI